MKKKLIIVVIAVITILVVIIFATRPYINQGRFSVDTYKDKIVDYKKDVLDTGLGVSSIPNFNSAENPREAYIEAQKIIKNTKGIIYEIYYDVDNKTWYIHSHPRSHNVFDGDTHLIFTEEGKILALWSDH